MLPDVSALQHFHFLRPAFALLFIVWLALIVAQNRKHTSRDMFGGIIAPHLLEHLRLQRFEARWFNPRSFGTAFAVLALLILMGPTWRQQPSPLNQDEAALVILLDASSSMEQTDIQPSRLRRAKQKISDLLALRPDKKAALVVYAGTAHTVLSLTADREILNQYLAAITAKILPRSGKFPEYALPLIDEILRDTNAPATVVMFADGLGADSAAAFEDYFTTQPHQLLVVGVGGELTGDGRAPLERASLEALAALTDGHYLSLSVDDGDMRQVNRRTESHYVVVEDSALPWLDSGYVLIFPAMALFLLWFRKGWTLTWSWVALALVLQGIPPTVYAQETDTALAPAVAADQLEASTDGTYLQSALQWFTQLWLTGDQHGRLLMQWERYPQAASHFTDPMWKGLSYYYSEEFMLAAEYFSRRDSDNALFNEANARAQGRDYVRAVHRYDRLLARNPQFPGALANRTRVQDIIDEINRISESQQQEPGVSGEDKELGGDDAIPAQGADELTWEKAEVKQLTAEDILQDPATAEMWLRGVQQDPSSFLATKFSMQLLRREASPQSEPSPQRQASPQSQAGDTP